MKVIFTIAKQTVENGIIKGHTVDELVAEDVAGFSVDDARQIIYIKYNHEADEVIKLQDGTDIVRENWFLMDIKVMEVPLKVKL